MQFAEAAFLSALPDAVNKAAFARSAYTDLEKPRLRTVLYTEQGYLCVYCERRLAESHPAPRIDHWRPLSLNPQLALHWRNLYLSCPSEESCDVRKRDQPLRAEDADEDLPWPIEQPYEQCVGFTSLGEMYVRNDAAFEAGLRESLVFAVGMPHDKVTSDNGVLNLNHPTLVAARAAAVDSERSRLEREYPDTTASKDDRAARATQMLGEHPLPEFVSIRVAWLRRSLGKGR